MKREDEDATLMLRVRDGDRDAFETLVRRYERLAHATAFRFLGDATLAQDIAQEAFLRLYRTRARYRATATFRTFFYRILTNLCYSALRKSARMISLEQTRESGDRPIGQTLADERLPTPSTTSEQNEIRAAVREAIDSLPQKQRMALILTRFQGLSYRETASAMKTSTKAVKSLLVRGREKLRERLSPYVRP